MLILCIIAAVLTYPLWMFIHEYSHLRTMKKLVGVEWSKMYLYPHRHNGNFYWARVQYLPSRQPEPWEQMHVLIAPRMPDILGGMLAVTFCILGLYPLAILAAGGIIDLFVGSLGITPASDLQRVVANSNGMVSANDLRISGLVISVIYTILCIVAVTL